MTLIVEIGQFALSPMHPDHKFGLWQAIPPKITAFSLIAGDLLTEPTLPKVRSCIICGFVETEK